MAATIRGGSSRSRLQRVGGVAAGSFFENGERYARGRMGYHPWMDVGHGPHDAPSPQTCCDERRADDSCQRGCQAGGKGACWRTGPGREWDRLHFAGDCPRLSRLPADKPLQRLVFWNGLNTIRCGNVRVQKGPRIPF